MNKDNCQKYKDTYLQELKDCSLIHADKYKKITLSYL